MPAVDDETSDAEREDDDRGSEERAAVAYLLALRATTTRTSMDGVDATVEDDARIRTRDEDIATRKARVFASWHHALACESRACAFRGCARAKARVTHVKACEDETCARLGESGACRRARAEWERHLTHRFDRCSTCAKTREIVRANRAFFPIPERRRGVVERIVARVDGARRRAAREGEKDAAARTPARMTPPTGSETTAPVEETVDAGVYASVIERVRTGVDATTIESPNSDDAKSDTTRGPTNELLEEEEEEEEEEEIQCTQTQDHGTCLPEEIQCTQTYTDSRALVQTSAQDLIIIDGSDDERDEHAERENAADDDEDGSARKKPKLSRESYTMAQITSMVCSYAAEEGEDLEEIFSKIRSAAAESAREHIQRDRRRLEMHASRLDKNI